MSFIGSAELWGESATARLHQIMVEANSGLMQQIAENKTNLLECLSKEELEAYDEDFELNACYLAVYYDHPSMIYYLHKRGLDFSKTCDPMDFGTPMFYAVLYGRIHIINALHKIGISVNRVCDNYLHMTPKDYASMRSNQYVIKMIDDLLNIDRKSYDLFVKNYLKLKYRRLYLYKRRRIIIIQRFIRRFLKKLRFEKIRLGLITIIEEESYTESESKNTENKHDNENSTLLDDDDDGDDNDGDDDEDGSHGNNSSQTSNSKKKQMTNKSKNKLNNQVTSTASTNIKASTKMDTAAKGTAKASVKPSSVKKTKK